MTDREDFERFRKVPDILEWDEKIGEYYNPRTPESDLSYRINEDWRLWQAARTGEKVKALEIGGSKGYDTAVNDMTPGFCAMADALGIEVESLEEDLAPAANFDSALNYMAKLLEPFHFAGVNDEGKLIVRTGGEASENTEAAAEAYMDLAGTLEPYIQRMGKDDDEDLFLSASVIESVEYLLQYRLDNPPRTGGEVDRQGVTQRVREAVRAICDDTGVRVQSLDVGWGKGFGDAAVLTVGVVTCE